MVIIATNNADFELYVAFHWLAVRVPAKENRGLETSTQFNCTLSNNGRISLGCLFYLSSPVFPRREKAIYLVQTEPETFLRNKYNSRDIV